MKKLKKLISVILTFAMVLAMSMVAFANGDNEGNKGTITVDNAIVGQTYSIYKLLDVELGTTQDGQTVTSYSYTVKAPWIALFSTTEAKKVFTTEEIGSVTYVKGVDEPADADVQAFAQAALSYANKNEIEADDTEKAVLPENAEDKTATITSISFTDLPLGYYLLDSTTGALCSLNTTDKSVTIKEKNEAPTVDKKVQENSTEEYGKANDAKIGDTVNFQATVEVKKGAQGYVLKDTMSTGLTFDADYIVVTVGENALDNTNNAYYTLRTGDARDDKTTTFELAFTDAFYTAVKGTNDEGTAVVSYRATLNENAVIAGDNKNEVKLQYGDENETVPSETTTKTWKIPVFKYFATTSTVEAENGEKTTTTVKNGLAGAKFQLTSEKTETKDLVTYEFVDVTKTTDTDPVYRIATSNDKTKIDTITTGTTGKFTIVGLDSGTYALTETEAPTGYNKLKDPISVTIAKDGTISTLVDGFVDVENKQGITLPSTGGMGTTILYAAGTVLVLLAGAALVIKRRREA